MNKLWKNPKHPIYPTNPRPDYYSVRRLFTGLAFATLSA
jgi:hypothetical protein